MSHPSKEWIHPTAVIHPGAIIHPGAKIGAEVKIGPHTVIGEDVEIGDGCELKGQVYLEGPLKVGPANTFFPHGTIGVIPQDKKFHGERTETVIGEGNTFRECVTVHRGTEGGGGVTRVGDQNLVMAYSHIAHDCIVGDETVLANGVTLAGHVRIEDYAVIGAFTGVHQFCRVGRHSIVGGYSVITKDVLPFSMTVSERETKLFGLNRVGLERHGFSAEQREKLRQALRLLKGSKLSMTQAREQIQAAAAEADGSAIGSPTGSEELQELLRFIESSERGVIR